MIVRPKFWVIQRLYLRSNVFDQGNLKRCACSLCCIYDTINDSRKFQLIHQNAERLHDATTTCLDYVNIALMYYILVIDMNIYLQIFFLWNALEYIDVRIYSIYLYCFLLFFCSLFDLVFFLFCLFRLELP